MWSEQQQAIFAWFAGGQGNLIVRARAGTGKTTTIIEALKHAPEQRILLAAFNKRIQVELQERISNPAVEALTLHGVGFAAVRRYWERLRVDSRGERALALAESVCGQQAPDPIKRLVAKLVTRAREMAPLADTGDELEALAIECDLTPDDQWAADGWDLERICDLAVEAMEQAADEKPTRTGIDFADMLFLPIRNRWLRPTYDLVIVDEAQDMTAVQLALARGVVKPGGRIAVVGDDRQAIYRFRGADSGALDRLKAELQADELGLTTTYRCGRAIVARAQRLVPDYRAAPDAPCGMVRELERAGLLDAVRPGDFVLSRTNAPLVAVALGLIRRGVRTKIEGKDIGAGLTALVRQLATGKARDSMPAFLERLERWKDREQRRAEAAKLDGKIDEIADRYETMLALCDGVSGIRELEARLADVFADTGGKGSQVVCSSVHRAKGLEAERVFVLADTLRPSVQCEHCRHRHTFGPCKCGCATYHPDALAQREEENIEYVAVTRARAELVMVRG